MAIRTVTGNIQQVTGAASPGGFFTVAPVDPVRSVDAEAVMIGEPFRVTADGSGEFSFGIEEGEYQMIFVTSGGDLNRHMTVDSAGPWAIGRLMGLSAPVAGGLAQRAFAAADRAEEAALSIPSMPQVTVSGSSYAITQADAGKLLVCTSASAVTLTMPTGIEDVPDGGVVFNIAQYGAGLVTLAPAAGVTLNNLTDPLAIGARYRVVTAIKLAGLADTFLVLGVT